MSLEKITEKIMNESNENARHAIVKAKRQSREALRKARCLGDDIMDERKEQAAADAVTLKSRKEAVAELEARKLRLAAKQEAVSRAFDLALTKLAAMPEKEYVDFLVKAVCEAAEEGGEILLSEKDRGAVGDTLVKRVNASGSCGKVTLSEKTIRAKGGFILKNGAVEINSTLETMVEAVRESVTPEVVAALFQ